jgi:hypothetical protein
MTTVENTPLTRLLKMGPRCDGDGGTRSPWHVITFLCSTRQDTNRLKKIIKTLCELCTSLPCDCLKNTAHCLRSIIVAHSWHSMLALPFFQSSPHIDATYFWYSSCDSNFSSFWVPYPLCTRETRQAGRGLGLRICDVLRIQDALLGQSSFFFFRSRLGNS